MSPEQRAALDKLKAAVELHRPVMYDKWGYVTQYPAEVKRWRCRECSRSVPTSGCNTWQTAGL